VLLGRDHALEVEVLDRVVLDVDGHPAVSRVERQALGDGPADEDALDLEAEVVVEPRRAMALDDEPARAGRRSGRAGRFRRLCEVALAAVVLERHRRSVCRVRGAAAPASGAATRPDRQAVLRFRFGAAVSASSSAAAARFDRDPAAFAAGSALPSRAFLASATLTGFSPARAAFAALTDASSAAIRSTSLPVSSAGSGALTSWPSIFDSMTCIRASRYSSLYSAGSNAPVIADTSCRAIASSAGLKSYSSSGRSSSLVERISSGQWRVVRTIVSPNGSSAASASRSLMTTLQIAVRPSSWSTERRR